MAFDGLKKIFDMIGGATIDSSKKVGEGVQVPVNKLGDIRSRSRSRSRSGLGSRRLGSMNDSSPRVIERMKMDKDEIQMFKELIDKKYERTDKPKEDNSQRDAYQKASLEELLKEEDKEGLDPKLIMGMGAVSFVLVMVIMVVLGFGIEIGLVFGMLIFLMSAMIVFLPKLQKGKKSSEASKELPYALR
jgi:flagellar protein FlaJ